MGTGPRLPREWGATSSLFDRRNGNPRFLFVYPPLQFQDIDDESIRPDSSLAMPYLHAALTAAGFDCDILDASVGRSGRDRLQDTFYRRTPLPHIASDMVRLDMGAGADRAGGA